MKKPKWMSVGRSMGKGRPHFLTIRQKDQIRRWLAEDRGWRWIAEQFDLSQSTMMKIACRYNLRANRTGPKAGERHPGWTGGRILDKDGYVLLYAPWHPHCRQKSASSGHPCYVLEHRLVMENKLGRYLKRTEVVHHKNGNKSDNRIANLELFQSNADHLRHELTGRTPRWTKDGQARIQRALRKGRAIQKALRRGAQQTLQKLYRIEV